jgi:hypothetical protein
VTVDLTAAPSSIHSEWFDPASGEIIDGGNVTSERSTQLKAPFRGAAVLHLSTERRLNP